MLPSFNHSLIQQQQQLNQAHQVQQQQQQQQPLQSSGDPQQPRAGFSNPESQRHAWQQMMHLQNQQQFRAQNGADMPGSHQQLADLLRNQTMHRSQSGGQQPPFAMNTTVGQQPQQHQHPQQQNFLAAPNSQPALSLPSNFANMAALNPAARNALMQAANQGQMSRQLELLQQRSGQYHYPPRGSQPIGANGGAQQGQTQGSPPEGGFSSPSGHPGPSDPLKSSPAIHPVQQQPSGGATSGQAFPPNMQNMPAGRRPMTFNELKDRYVQVKELLSQTETAATQLASQRTAVPETVFLPKMQTLLKEIQNKKEYLAKVHQAMQVASSAGIVNGQSLNISHTSSSTQAPTWLSQNSTVKPPGYSLQMATSLGSTMNHRSNGSNPQLGNRGATSPMPALQQQSQGHLLSPQYTHNNAAPFDVNGNGPSHIQQQLQRNGINMNNLPMPFPPPLDKSKFESAYGSYCKSKNLVHDARLMAIDGRTIDLHALHVQVLSEGGAPKVHQNDLWAVIGARLGFVQFPGSDTEPAKSGPGVAQQLAHVYKEYLSVFDGVYVHSVQDSRRKLMAVQQQQQTAQNQATGAFQMRGLNAQQMQAVLSYANLSAEQLRAQGVAERIIQFVEVNRTHLQRTVTEQGLFRGQLRPSQNTSQNSDAEGQAPSNAAQFPPPRPPGIVGLQTVGSRPSPQFNAAVSVQNGNMENRPVGLNASLIKPEHLQMAVNFIAKAEADYAPNLAQMRPQEIPNDMRIEFNAMLEQLHRLAMDMKSKAAMYFVLVKAEESIRRLVAIISTVQQQRNLLSSNPPKHILNMEMLRGMLNSVQKYSDHFQSIMSAMMSKQQQQSQLMAASNGSDSSLPLQRRNQTTPQPLPQPPQATARPSPMQPPSKKLRQQDSSPATAPTPPSVASASTPVANAPTPTQVASSPQPPKSPKAKPVAKAKKRRPSKAQPPHTSIASAPTPQSESEPVTAPSPSASLKRQRDESSTSAAASTSSPKRSKPDPETEPTRRVDVSTIKTEDDTSAFLEQMTELLKQAAHGEGQEGLSSDISDALGVILKEYGGDDSHDISGPSSVHGLDLSVTNVNAAPVDEFPEFLDLSSYGNQEDEESGSKAPTPDLVSSSSTNPSPESASEADVLVSKLEDTPDPLRLGVWKEIDGGESSYYTQGDWKWDSPMPTLEQPWAIFTS